MLQAGEDDRLDDALKRAHDQTEDIELAPQELWDEDQGDEDEHAVLLQHGADLAREHQPHDAEAVERRNWQEVERREADIDEPNLFEELENVRVERIHFK